MGYRNLTRMSSRSDGLLERAEAALQNTVAANPNDPTALLRLGDVQRGRGRLDDALECYQRVLSIRPGDEKASWLVAILSGKDLPEAPQVRGGPVPFLRTTDFLPPRRWRELLALAQANREQFEPGVDGRHVDPSRPKTLVELRLTDREVRPWFEPRLRDAFAEALSRLRMRRREHAIKMSMSVHLSGCFLAKHTDDAPSPYPRTLNATYYFYRQPRRFSGGDLLLHDATGAWERYTRIEPLHNSIVIFPAWAVHQTTAVETSGSQGEDFGDARFAINGWLRTYATERA